VNGHGPDPVEAGPDEFIFSFHSTSEAIMGEKRLLDAGLRVTVMPAPPQIGPGCGICLRVQGADLEKARAILGPGCRAIFRRTLTGKSFVPWNP
jgi:hypothetical protein